MNIFNKLRELKSGETKTDKVDKSSYAGKDLGKIDSSEFEDFDKIVAKKGYVVYRDMLYDEQIKFCLTIKKFLILSPGYIVEPFDDSAEAAVQAKFIQDNFNGTDTFFDNVLFQTLSALEYGFSFGEIVWKRDVWENSERILLDNIKFKFPWDIDMEYDEYGNLIEVKISNESVKMDKFILYSYMAQFGNKKGESDLKAVYDSYWLKKQITKFHARYLERFSSPIVKGHVPPGATDKETNRFYVLINRLTNIVGILLPRTKHGEEFDFELVETKRAGGNQFIASTDQCNTREANAMLIPRLFGACLSKDALILTNDGVKKITEVKVGEKVYSDNGKFNKVTKIFKTENETRDCYQIKSNNLIATSNHRFLIARLKWATRKEMREGATKNCHKDRIQRMEWVSVEDLSKLTLSQRHTRRLVVPLLDSKGRGSFKEGKILGFGIGDGYLPKRGLRKDGTKRICNWIEFYFNPKSEVGLCEKYVKTLESFGVKIASKKIHSAALTLGFSNAKFSKLINEVEANPNILYSKSRKFCSGVLQGLLDSDGYVGHGSKMITQKPGKIETIMAICCLKVGVPLKYYNIFSSGKGFGKKGSLYHVFNIAKKYTTISSCGKYMLIPIGRIKKVETPETTWNLSVEGRENYLVLPFMISHNSKESFGSYALGVEQFKIVYKFLSFIGSNLANDVINRQLIKRMIDYNFPVRLYPKLVFNPLDITLVKDTVEQTRPDYPSDVKRDEDKEKIDKEKVNVDKKDEDKKEPLSYRGEIFHTCPLCNAKVDVSRDKKRFTCTNGHIWVKKLNS